MADRNSAVANMSLGNDSQNRGLPIIIWNIRNACIPTWLLIIMFGLLGNALTVALLSSPNLRRHSTSMYLRWLAVVDILYLLCSLTVNLVGYVVFFPDSIRDTSVVFCLGLPFLHYTLSYLSVWLLVAVTVDRMLWVVLPFQARKICNDRNALVVVATLVLAFVSIDLHFFFTVRYAAVLNRTAESRSGWTCEADPFFNTIYPYIDLVLLLVVPIALMVLCNAAIICKLRRLKRIRETHLQCSAESVKHLQQQQQQQGLNNKRRRKASSSLTAMLLSINIFFVVSITPLLVYDIVYFAVDLKALVAAQEERFGGLVFGVEQIVYTLWYLNFSAHFLLYCMSGPRFRSEAVKLFRCRGVCTPECQDEAVTEFMTRRISSHYRQ